MDSKHRIVLTDQEIRMVLIGLDIYAQQWDGYARRRERSTNAMRGTRINSADEKKMMELMRSDVLAAEGIVKKVTKLRDHLASLIVPTLQ